MEDLFPEASRLVPTARADGRHDPVDSIPALPRHAESNATRYMAAAAYLDQDFASTVIEEVLHQPYRAVAPSYGFDIGTVVRHCLAAQRLIVARNVAVLAVLALALLVDVGGTLTLALVGFLLRSTVRLAVRTAHEHRLSLSPRVVAAIVVLILLAVLISTGLLDDVLGAVPVVLWSLLQGGAGLGDLFGAIGEYLKTFAGPLILLGGVWVVLFVDRLIQHRTVLEKFTERSYRPVDAPPVPPRHQRRLEYLVEAQTGNTTVYARKISAFPFVGSGTLRAHSSLTVPLVAEADDAGTDAGTGGRPSRRITVHDFYEAMRPALVDLADPEGDEAGRLPGLSLQDRVFVSGLLPVDHPLIDRRRGCPRFRVRPDDVRRLAEQERGRATHYLAVRIAAWEGELEITVFLFFSVRGNMLYTELVATVLPPIKDEYHAIDEYEILTPGVIARAGLRALAGSLSAGVMSPAGLIRMTWRALRRGMELQGQGRSIQERLAFDYGATTSIREIAAEWRRKDFFQDADAERYIAIVERRVFEAIGSVLHQFGFRTDEFEHRVDMVIDNSTHISNSQVHNSAFASGRDASASVSGAGAAASRPPRESASVVLPTAPTASPSRNPGRKP